MKIIFFGTPDYVIPIVEKINSSFKDNRERSLIAVVTQPPKPAGRGNKLEYSQIDHWAYKHNIEKIYDLENVPEADLGVVASYGKIIPDSVINKFTHGLLNIHPSLLPDLRGASPVQATLAKGYTKTGLTIIKMDEKLDHGPIVSSFKDVVLKTDTTETLRNRLFEKSADFIVELIPNYINNKIKLKTQDHSKATFTKLVKKQDAFIEPLYLKKLLSGDKIDEKIPLQYIKEFKLEVNAQNINNIIRAMLPWPVAWTHININKIEKRLKLLKAHVEANKLVLDEVQLEGKNKVSWEQFKKGYPDFKFK